MEDDIISAVGLLCRVVAKIETLPAEVAGDKAEN
jgi:hypothetical protein